MGILFSLFLLLWGAYWLAGGLGVLILICTLILCGAFSD